VWFYPPPTQACFLVNIEAGVVESARETEACAKSGVHPGISTEDVRRLLGPPHEVCSQYTRSAGHRDFRMRAVCFVDGRATTIIRDWFRD
jgi:hypothetical protein